MLVTLFLQYNRFHVFKFRKLQDHVRVYSVIITSCLCIIIHYITDTASLNDLSVFLKYEIQKSDVLRVSRITAISFYTLKFKDHMATKLNL